MAYRVLIASPSDVREERNAVESTILRWNAANAQTGVVLVPVRWERDSVPALGAPAQDLLNQQIVDGCDLGIGVFWARLGTPTAHAASGTVEEIERLRDADKRVMPYFSHRPAPSDSDEKQLAALQQYKRQCEASGLYQMFSDAADLSLFLFQHLSAVIPTLVAADGRSAFARRSTSTESRLELLTVEDVSRPEFEVAISAVRRTPSNFAPEFRLRQISGPTVAQVDWRVSAAGVAGPWNSTFSSSMDRTHLIGEFDLTGRQKVLVGDLWLHLRYIWNGRWRHERHRWPMRQIAGANKRLIELESEALPPQYWTSNSPDDDRPPD